jgi:hypothetical protein
MPEVFKDRDADYLEWCRDHPSGFVVNTTRSSSPSYMKLHRASCWTVIRLFGRGRQLTGPYIKVCAMSRQDLESWATRHQGVLDPCPLCAG